MRNSLIAIAVAALTSTSALADSSESTDSNTPSYSYVGLSVGFVNLDSDEGLNDIGIASLYGGVEIGSNFHIGIAHTAAATEIDRGTHEEDWEESDWRIGMGFHAPLNPSTSLHMDISYTSVNLDIDGHNIDLEDDDMTGVVLGVRSNVTENWEVNGGIAYTSYNSDQTGALYTGIVYTFASGFGLTLAGSINEDETTSLMAGVRYTF